MHIWINRAAARKIGLGAAILVASVGTVAAGELYLSSPANQYYSPYENDGRFEEPNPGVAPSRADRNQFDRSGTRGRQGLGASPLHPEGPGNVSD
jgi:hypothetical protein